MILELAKRKNITELLHFTTSKGLIGILDSRRIKSRYRIEDDQRLSHILNLNTPNVLDHQWIDFVNFSISRINSRLYEISSNKWHKKDISWYILSFSPSILAHDGVYFTTTNNIYTGVKRMPGVQGFEALFEPTITKWQNCSVHRSHSLPTFYTTCEQAEVLYPKECSTEYLQRIYVQNDDDLQQIDAMIGFVDHHAVEVIVDPSKFGNQT